MKTAARRKRTPKKKMKMGQVGQEKMKPSQREKRARKSGDMVSLTQSAGIACTFSK